MKSQAQLISDMRDRIGKPTVDQTTPAELNTFLGSALEALAERWQNVILTDTTSLLLVADQLEYPLPDNVIHLIWVEWSTTKLAPFSTYHWERDGKDWRRATSGVLTEYAIQGRTLILSPPPSAAAIVTDSVLSYRYVGTAPDLAPTGINYFSDSDLDIAVEWAAAHWLGTHPGEKPETVQARGIMQATCEKMLQLRLVDADRRHANPIVDYTPNAAVVTRRRGAAR